MVEMFSFSYCIENSYLMTYSNTSDQIVKNLSKLKQLVNQHIIFVDEYQLNMQKKFITLNVKYNRAGAQIFLS